MNLSIYFLVTLFQLHASGTCKYTDSSHLSQRKRLDLYQLRPQGLFVFRYGGGGECNLCSLHYIGETKRRLKVRFNQHIRPVDKTYIKSRPLIVSKHFLSNSDNSHTDMQQQPITRSKQHPCAFVTAFSRSSLFLGFWRRF